MFKKIITLLLIILLLFSIIVMGAPTYVNVGPTTEFEGDIKIISEIVAEGTTANEFETTFFITDPTADRTFTFPDSDQTYDLSLYYLKTEIDTQGEMETIWGVTLENETHASEHAVGGADTVFPADPNADKYLMWDDVPGELVWAEGGGGYTNLTQFIDQTAWRLFYSNNLGDVTELAFGTSGQYLKSTGATSAPIFDTPAGAGDMLKATYDTDADGDIDVAAGGTEKSAWTLYCIPYLSGTTAFGEITIGTAGQVLKVAAGATGYEWGTLSYLANVVEDTTPELGGELDAGAHTIGFTLQTDTGTGAKTIDWKLGNKMKFTFGAGNVTFTFTAPTNPCTVMLTLIQDGVGSRTVTWPATVKWPGGTAPTLTTTANARDKVALDWDGTQYDGVCSKDFK